VSEERPAGDSLLLVLLKSLAAFAAVAAANAGRRAAVMVLGYLFVAGFVVVGLCFLTAAGYTALARALGDSAASLIVGAVYLVAGLALALVIQLRRR
jgi:hypothetical protein